MIWNLSSCHHALAFKKSFLLFYLFLRSEMLLNVSVEDSIKSSNFFNVKCSRNRVIRNVARDQDLWSNFRVYIILIACDLGRVE